MKTKQFPVNGTFDVAAPASMMVEGFEDYLHPSIPVKQDYTFRREHLRDILAFLATPFNDALYIAGPTGSGKTSLICQVAARINWPVQQVACHGRLELSELIGQFTMRNGGMEFVHGPVSLAVRDGHILVLNELDLMEPSELAGLNDILQGQPLVIPQNGGEVIKPHPKFRMIATGNSAGQGDQTGLYQGILQQNLAFMDRFRIMEIGYPEPADEKKILQQALGTAGVAMDKVTEVMTEKMIEVANDIRRLFIGGQDGSGELSVTMSTRTLVRWAMLTVSFKRAPNLISYALERALTMRVDSVQKEAIHQIAKEKFGDLWDAAP